MIPNEVYQLACAMEGVPDDPCGAAIQAAWQVFKNLEEAGYTVAAKERP